ncbi:hypothetical protein EA658_09915 [Pseudoxanthomonas winnipegensis]|uniref:Uncharacterized protein n=1 Tax=Pseudoxanthomonas winnipegensis TaxID=2480810 RepID=A0ABY1WCV1_9GAMM|nr:hypothetical protein [Pseudoxanthomonas winnipegensis]TAA12452.1 hypothetical protein EA659_03735 [Pseudoxanthomonas winnipegensis]TAA19183.1 hypothetical protein EA658_09915 [Pseudoxanthomonas winnipegensis]TAH70444.1 hypothetical protein EA657_16980 [Pseudoxanthomonas winnipegensis]
MRQLPQADLEAQFEALKAEMERRAEAQRKATWARSKAQECFKRAAEIQATPTHGRVGKQGRNDRSATFARAEARDWEAKARRFEEEAGAAQADNYEDPF